MKEADEIKALSEQELRVWENSLEEKEKHYKNVEPILDYYLNSFWYFWRYTNFANTPESCYFLSLFDERESKFLNNFFADKLKKAKVEEEEREKVRIEKELAEQKKKEESQAKRKATIATKDYFYEIINKQNDLKIRLFWSDDLKNYLNNIYREYGLEAVQRKTEELFLGLETLDNCFNEIINKITVLGISLDNNKEWIKSKKEKLIEIYKEEGKINAVQLKTEKIITYIEEYAKGSELITAPF